MPWLNAKNEHAIAEEAAVRYLMAAFLAMWMGAAATEAQQANESWPTRSVTVIVPYGPGGASDGTARLFADRLSRKWGRPVVVENRPGADTVLGAGALVRAQDDHVLLYSAASTITITPLVQDNLPFDAAQDIIPIAPTCSAVFVVAVNNDVRAKSLDELVALVRAQPGKLVWSSAPGLPRYVVAAFLKRHNLDMIYVGYRDLATPQADLGEGRLHVLVTSQQSVIAPVETGKATIVAVANTERGPLLRLVPTAKEAGYADLTIFGLSGFFGSKSMSASLRNKIAVDVAAIAGEPEVRTRIEALGQKVVDGTPEEFAAAISEQRTWGEELARTINLKTGSQ